MTDKPCIFCGFVGCPECRVIYEETMLKCPHCEANHIPVGVSYVDTYSGGPLTWFEPVRAWREFATPADLFDAFAEDESKVEDVARRVESFELPVPEAGNVIEQLECQVADEFADIELDLRAGAEEALQEALNAWHEKYKPGPEKKVGGTVVCLRAEARAWKAARS